jgi:hypothetical protein
MTRRRGQGTTRTHIAIILTDKGPNEWFTGACSRKVDATVPISIFNLAGGVKEQDW